MRQTLMASHLTIETPDGPESRCNVLISFETAHVSAGVEETYRRLMRGRSVEICADFVVEPFERERAGVLLSEYPLHLTVSSDRVLLRTHDS